MITAKSGGLLGARKKPWYAASSIQAAPVPSTKAFQKQKRKRWRAAHQKALGVPNPSSFLSASLKEPCGTAATAASSRATWTVFDRFQCMSDESLRDFRSRQFSRSDTSYDLQVFLFLTRFWCQQLDDFQSLSSGLPTVFSTGCKARGNWNSCTKMMIPPRMPLIRVRGYRQWLCNTQQTVKKCTGKGR